MTTAHFHHLPDIVCQHLRAAEQQIDVAMCWFSHRDIYDTLLEVLKRGVKVQLLLEYDTQNIRDGGLDFNAFIHAGGRLYARREVALMHHKFALIDGKTLLSGSFNWTYNTNDENLIISQDSALISAFQSAFTALSGQTKRIFHTNKAEAKPFSVSPLFAPAHFTLPELRKKIGGGAKVWLLRTEKLYRNPAGVFQKQQLPFDAAGHFAPFWRQWRLWDQALGVEWLHDIRCREKAAVWRTLRLWTMRMGIGDLVLATTHNSQLGALGVISSDPQPFEEDRFSSFRAIHWFKVLEYPLPLSTTKLSPQPVVRFRGSSLMVLEQVFKV
jgi:PLD-like domain